MRIDPITFEVVNNALIGVAEQMAATILRTSYSTVVREMLDYSTAVFDPKGRIIETHPTPAERPTNCTFVGEDLYVSSIEGHLLVARNTGMTGYLLWPN